MSPTYLLGTERVRRKNFYMPCVLGPVFHEATPEEQAKLLKQTWWADLITDAEWKVILDHADASPSAKSRLKKKVAGWIIAEGRIALLAPDLYLAAVKEARQLYRDQVGERHPLYAEEEAV